MRRHDSAESDFKTNNLRRFLILCGVAGFWRQTSWPATEAKGELDAMLTALKHRGPDARGTWMSSDQRVSLGHTRLSIVDLSEDGAQPMTSLSGRYSLSFNGEIYNYKLLRSELKSLNKNLFFRGHSDTEVLLAAFDQWGIKLALKKCKGMFALAVWDESEQALILARDRFGEKPLLFSWQGPKEVKNLVFASELRSFYSVTGFSAKISTSAFNQYLGLGVVPDNKCIIEGVHKVPPAGLLYFKDPNEFPIADSFWSIEDNLHEAQSTNNLRSTDQLIAITRSKLETAVSQQLEADVPVGIFLSGGVDSSLVAALARKRASKRISTFSIGFEDPNLDESKHAAVVAKHLDTKHHTLTVSSEDLLSVIPSLGGIYDEPFSDSSQIPTVLLSRLTREHVTVALTGDGADELFFGYARYFRAMSWWQRLIKVPQPFRNIAGKMIGSAPHKRVNELASILARDTRYARLGEMLRDNAAAIAGRDLASTHLAVANGARLQEFNPSSMKTPFVSESLRDDLLLTGSDLLQYLPSDILVKTDRAAMSVGLETRCPFLDVDVAEHAIQLPTHLKWRGGDNKWVLRQILSEHLPASITQRPKRGFDVPLASWLRGPLRDWGTALIEDKSALEEVGLESARIRAIWNEHQEGSINHHEALWPVLMFRAWSEQSLQ